MGGSEAAGLTTDHDSPNKEDSDRQHEKQDVIQTEGGYKNKMLKEMDKCCKLQRGLNSRSGQAVSSSHVRASALYDHSYITLPIPLLGHPTHPQNSFLMALLSFKLKQACSDKSRMLVVYNDLV